MDYSQFLLLKEELSLILVIVILFVADLFMSPDAHKNDGKPVLNTMLPVALLTIHTLITIVPGPVADAFGGMYHNQPIQSIVKSILSIGTLIVFLMAHEWMRRPDTAIKQGEFYILTLSTLLGMYFMISAGHFLMFFIGLETASIPMAALVAFDKYRHHSAEAGAKYILTALFSSGLLLYGLSLIYGTVGTLYFADIPARLTGDPLQIMAFVFFFSGMGFKISLVPFHLWTADVYEGAPSTVTAYLSVISKGSAAFVLMATLIKVFAPMVEQWQEVLKSQLETGLKDVDKEKVVIAYEPIWAIGPGKTPPDEAYITKIGSYIKEMTGGMDVVYGGGLKTDNARMLASVPVMDGGLIALTRFRGKIGFYPEEYLEIVRTYLEQD